MPSTDFYRLKRLPDYVFETTNRIKAEARAEGRDIIDLGMGNPDIAVPKHIEEKLIESIQKPGTHRYSVSRGIHGLRKAVCAYYKRRFHVDLCTDTETIVTLGSKEGLANLAQAVTAPGDVIITPNPSYPIHPFGFIIAGASIRHIPANSPDEFLAALPRTVRHSVPKPTMMIVSYPSNPTAQTVDLEFYKQIVDFAREHDIWILSDVAYSEIYFEEPTPSILQIDGAKEIAVEFTTLSKTFSMAGYRIGFCSGNKHLVGALRKVKSYLDYGAFTPLQVAATAALNGPEEPIIEIRNIYKKRRDVLLESFGRAGWDIPAPKAGMFCWAPIPDHLKDMGSVEFTNLLLKEADVAVAPGIGFGEHGDGHVRIGLVENEHRIRQAGRNIKKIF
ncbi:MAG: LL-diaminopimelate aminotransferase [Pseudomonadota bacterium]